MDDQERQARELFTEAVALPQSEWQGFLARTCSDPVLRARVMLLLDHHAKSGDFLSRPATDTFPEVAGSLGGRIAEFRIVRELGRGGMGVVYLAEDTVLKRAVALKVLPPQIDGEKAASDRFRKEAQAVARLSHPGIVQIFRTGEERGFAYIAMEFIDGKTLRVRMNEEKARHRTGSHPTPMQGAGRTATGKRPTNHTREELRELADLISQVADALEHAHRQHIVHRDVKPSNILIDRSGHARLADFGVARITTEQTLTSLGDLAGSYAYMSPEQARVRSINVDHRSDVFSLGVVLYEALTFERPFGGETPEEVFESLSRGRPTRVASRQAGVPRDLATICEKAIELEPLDRYQTAGHMAADLRSFLADQPILASPPSLSRRLKRWVIQHKFQTTIAAASLLLTTVCALGFALKREWDSRLAWVRIRAEQPLVITLQAEHSATYRLGTPEIQRKVASSDSFSVPPGYYRMTFVADGTLDFPLFAEVDVLLEPRRDRSFEIQVVGPKSPWPVQASHAARLLPASHAPDPDMVRIASGIYDCGTGEGDGPLTQRCDVELPAFHIDRTEVSCREYLDFLYATAPDPLVRRRLDDIVAHRNLDTPNATGQRHDHPNTPAFWTTHGYDPALDDLPVVDVRLSDAMAYAAWRGKRLPDMFEWQAAACGQTPGSHPHFDFPMGLPVAAFDALRPPEQYVRLGQATDSASRVKVFRELSKAVAAVDPFATPAGLMHCFDNAREITSTLDLSHKDGVAMGRSWLDEPAHAPLAQPWTFPIDERYFDRGFRCARSVSPAHRP